MYSGRGGSSGNETGVIRWNDVVSLGRDVYFIGDKLDGDGELRAFKEENGVYEYFISPIPYYYEYPKIRRGYEGYLDVVFFEDDVSLNAHVCEGSEVAISLSSSRLLSKWSNIRYEGLVWGLVMVCWTT